MHKIILSRGFKKIVNSTFVLDNVNSLYIQGNICRRVHGYESSHILSQCSLLSPQEKKRKPKVQKVQGGRGSKRNIRNKWV